MESHRNRELVVAVKVRNKKNETFGVTRKRKKSALKREQLELSAADSADSLKNDIFVAQTEMSPIEETSLQRKSVAKAQRALVGQRYI